jgi:chemotaxis protein histidine kinase CheA
VVDSILDTQEIVVKPLGKQLKKVDSFAGATIMGDGGVALILDVVRVGRRAGVVLEREGGDARQEQERHASDDSFELHQLAGIARQSAGNVRWVCWWTKLSTLSPTWSRPAADQIGEMRLLIFLDRAKQDVAVIEGALGQWTPAHQDLWQATHKNNGVAAMSIYDKRALPQAKEMQKAVEDLHGIEIALIKAAVESGHSQVSRSNWIVISSVLLFLAVWGVAAWVVRRSSIEQQREAEAKATAAENLTQLLAKIEHNSEGLTASSNELTGISQQMAGAAEETAVQANVVSAASEQVSKNVEIVATSAEELMASIREISKSSNEAARATKNAAAITPDNYAFLQQYIYRESGIVLEQGKHSLLDVRLSPIVKTAQLQTINDLCALLKATGPSHVKQAVVEAMTTHETLFFRDHNAFEALRTSILPKLKTLRASTQRLTIWSAEDRP